MILRIVKLSLPILFLIGVHACKKAVQPQPNATACDSSRVTYNTCILPILKQYCISCHAKKNTSGGVYFDEYDMTKLIAQDGDLWGVVEHLDGYPYMPPVQTKIDSQSLFLIRKWIQEKEPEK